MSDKDINIILTSNTVYNRNRCQKIMFSIIIEKIKNAVLKRIFIYRMRWVIIAFFILIFLIYWMNFNVRREQSRIQCEYILGTIESDQNKTKDAKKECENTYSFKNLLFHF